LASDEDGGLDEENLDGDVDDTEEDEFEASEDEEVTAEIDEFDDAAEVGDDDGEGEDIDLVVALSSKEQSAKSLEIRRAIEERMEERRFHEDFDYLDLDMDD